MASVGRLMRMTGPSAAASREFRAFPGGAMSSPGSARQQPQTLGQTSHGAGMQPASPGLGKAQRGRHMVETLPFQIVPANQGAFIFRELVQRSDQDLAQLGVR